MSQQSLFYEDVFDVARAMVQAAGGTKAVASKLWPHKPIAEAQRELLDCLNRERPRKFCIEEFLALIRMSRDAGFHQGKHWIDSDTGYQPTNPVDPLVERDRLAEELAALNASVRAMTQAAERLLDPKLKAVK